MTRLRARARALFGDAAGATSPGGGLPVAEPDETTAPVSTPNAKGAASPAPAVAARPTPDGPSAAPRPAPPPASRGGRHDPRPRAGAGDTASTPGAAGAVTVAAGADADGRPHGPGHAAGGRPRGDGESGGDAGATPTPPLPAPTRWERFALPLRARLGTRPAALAALAVVLLVAVVLAGHHFWSGRPQRVTAPPAEPATATSPPAGDETAPSASPARPRTASREEIVVDVAGKVRRPGLYRLPAGSRVDDALRAAGGVRRGTDTTPVNRARLLVDGEQLLIGVPAAGDPAGDPAGPGTSASGAPAQPGTRLSLNSATAEQLQTLPGVGPVLAQHILEYRRQQGGFSSVDQLREVNGIGERRFADLATRVTP